MLQSLRKSFHNFLGRHKWYETEVLVQLRDVPAIQHYTSAPNLRMTDPEVSDIITCERCSLCGNRRQYSRAENKFYWATRGDKRCYVP